MPDFPHLARAPIVEALIHFQANAAEQWEPKKVRSVLQPAWPEHTNVQEMRPVQFQMKQEKGKEPEANVSLPGVDGLLFRAKGLPTVYHARRDGLIVSWLAPYADWLTFVEVALTAWGKFREILTPSALHSVALRYINRLEFPVADFSTPDLRLSTFFTAPPAKPPKLSDWKYRGFSHETNFVAPSSRCVVRTNFSQTQSPPDMAAFILDIEVRLREPLMAMDGDTKEILEEMRTLKNTVFFAMLTDAALERYK